MGRPGSPECCDRACRGDRNQAAPRLSRPFSPSGRFGARPSRPDLAAAAGLSGPSGRRATGRRSRPVARGCGTGSPPGPPPCHDHRPRSPAPVPLTAPTQGLDIGVFLPLLPPCRALPPRLLRQRLGLADRQAKLDDPVGQRLRIGRRHQRPGMAGGELPRRAAPAPTPAAAAGACWRYGCGFLPTASASCRWV